MDNRFFDDEMIAVLQRPWSWRLVTPFFPPDTRPVTDGRHQRWRSAQSAASQSLNAPGVLIVLKGSTTHGFGDKLYRCGPGTVVYFDGRVRGDQGYPPWSPDTTHLWIIVTPREVYGCLHAIRAGRSRQIRDTICLFGPEEGAFLIRHLREWAERTPPIPADVIRMRLVSAVAFMVARMVALGFEEQSPRATASDRDIRLERIRRHILQTAGRGVRLDQLARMAGYSKFHFLRLFRAHAGESLRDYINGCRVRRVQELLKAGLPLKVIGEELGFASPSSFSRWYRQHKLPSDAQAAT